MKLNPGKLDPQEKTYIPESEQQHKVVSVARLWILIYASASAWQL